MVVFYVLVTERDNASSTWNQRFCKRIGTGIIPCTGKIDCRQYRADGVDGPQKMERK